METMLKLFDREVDSYWLSKGFILNSCKFVECHSKFKDLLKVKLEIEDAALHRFASLLLYCLMMIINDLFFFWHKKLQNKVYD